MIRLRTFPNLIDDFLIAYRYAEILSLRWRVKGEYTFSTLPFNSIDHSYLKLLDCSVPKNSLSFWIGNPNSFELDLNKNIAFITNEKYKNNEILNKMNYKISFKDKDFLFPFKKIDINTKNYVLVYSVPIEDRLLYETIEAYILSNIQYPLRILAAYYSEKPIEEYIKHLKYKYNSNKNIYLCCINNIHPERIINELIKAKYIIDFRLSSSVSFSSVIANSSGIPCATTEFTFPAGSISVPALSNLSIDDGRELSGRKVGFFSTEQFVDALNSLESITELTPYDNSIELLNFFEDLIKRRN
jgi:hypothetical protein